MTEQLEILFPQGKEVILNGKQFTIKPLTFGQMPKVLKAVSSAANAVENLKIKSAADIKPEDVLNLLAEAGEDLIPLFMDILKQDREFIESIQMDESVELITAFYEVNSDFFSKRVAPLIQKALKK